MNQTHCHIGDCCQVEALFLSAVLLIQISIEQIQNHQSHPEGHGLHQSQNLSNLIVRHSGGQKNHSAKHPHIDRVTEAPGHSVKSVGDPHIQNNIKGHIPVNMNPEQSHLNPGNQVIQNPKPGASHCKYCIPEGLIIIAVPLVKVIHIKTFQLHVAVNKKSKAGQHKNNNYFHFPECSPPHPARFQLF